LHGVLANVALHEGNVDRAALHVRLAEEAMATTTPLLGTDLHARAQARLAEAKRDVAGASAIAVGAWDVFDAMGVIAAQRNVGFDALRLAHLVGDDDTCHRIADGWKHLASLASVPSDHVTAAFAAALCAGDPDAMVAAASGSTRGSTGSGQPLRRAHMGELAASALWSAGRRDEAAGVLQHARRIYADAGAVGDVRRTAELFAALGLRRPPPSERPTTGWDALTPSERRIAALVGTGAGNAAIAETLGVSRRTVETHLRHVYAKLEVTSRVELALAVDHEGNLA
jgi:DNA-binding CsgD family transcriptional regulator